MRTTREQYKMRALYAVWAAMWVGLVLIAASQGHSAEFPNEFHDPALDTINNNLSILDADLNGNFDVLNTNVAKLATYGKDNADSNTVTRLNSAGLPSQYGGVNSQNSFVSGGHTNAMGLSNAMSQVFSNYGRFLGPVVTNLGDIINTNQPELTNFPTFALSIPKLYRGAPGVGYTTTNVFLGDISQYVDPSIPAGCRIFILGFTVILYFFALLDDLKKNVGETFQQKQTVGTPQGVFGWNASLPTSLFYSFVITAAVVSLCIAIGAMGFSRIMEQIGTVGGWQESAFGWLSSVPFFGLLNQFVPVWNLVLLHIFYLLGRTLILQPAFLCVRCLILWMPA